MLISIPTIACPVIRNLEHRVSTYVDGRDLILVFGRGLRYQFYDRLVSTSVSEAIIRPPALQDVLDRMLPGNYRISTKPMTVHTYAVTIHDILL
jgi:hypothetical protein